MIRNANELETNAKKLKTNATSVKTIRNANENEDLNTDATSVKMQ